MVWTTVPVAYNGGLWSTWSVVERLGKFSRVCYSGLTFAIPFVEVTRPVFFRALEVDVDGTRRVVTKRSELIDLREQVLDFPKQSVITKDNVMMEIDGALLSDCGAEKSGVRDC